MYRSCHLIGAGVGALALAMTAMAGPAGVQARSVDFNRPAAEADQATVTARSVNWNRAERALGTDSIDYSRATLPAVVFAPVNAGVPEGPPVPPCGQDLVNCQVADQAGHGEAGIIGATSDLTVGFHVIEGFRNDSELPEVISEVCWTGFYLDFDLGEDCADTVLVDDFTITFYLNDPGCPFGAPDLVIGIPANVGDAVSRTATGNMVGGQVEYAYSAAVAFDILGKTCYWLGIQNNTPGTAANCVWLWSTAPGDGNSHQDGAPDPINDFDLAVCTNLGIGDQSFCDLDPDVLCIGATGNCFEPNGSPGCDDECCCTLVCQTPGLDFCCFSPWISACADVALDLGCTQLPPLPLCQPDANCQIYTALNAFNSTGDTSKAGADLFHAADDFTPAVSGDITSLCFQGAYSQGTLGIDDFVVKFYDDVDGLPGAVPIAERSQLAGTMTLDLREDTNLEIIVEVKVWQYNTTIDAVAVVAGNCYWIEIVNNVGQQGLSWFWEWAETGYLTASPGNLLPRQGNGRCLVDGVGDGLTEPDGYTFFDDTVTSNDFAFCIGLELATPACGFSDMDTDTGPHQTCLFNGAASHLGWISGDLTGGAGVDDQRRCVQAFTLPVLPAGPSTSWGIEHLLLEGFDVAGNVNEFINFEIFTRTALDVAPGPADSVVQLLEIAIPPDPADYIDGATEELGIISQDLFLDPGDYWLTFWASNSSGGASPADVAWFTNAPDGINNFCTKAMPPPAAGFEGCIPNDPGPNGDPPNSPAMLRARNYPDPGFGAYTLDPSVLDVDPVNDPTPVAADLYNAAFRLRMRPGVPPVLCPWDCEATPDGNVGVNDFLALLAQWTTEDTCDFDGGGVGVTDFLALLANWGLCP